MTAGEVISAFASDRFSSAPMPTDCGLEVQRPRWRKLRDARGQEPPHERSSITERVGDALGTARDGGRVGPGRAVVGVARHGGLRGRAPRERAARSDPGPRAAHSPDRGRGERVSCPQTVLWTRARPSTWRDSPEPRRSPPGLWHAWCGAGSGGEVVDRLPAHRLGGEVGLDPGGDLGGGARLSARPGARLAAG